MGKYSDYWKKKLQEQRSSLDNINLDNIKMPFSDLVDESKAHEQARQNSNDVYEAGQRVKEAQIQAENQAHEQARQNANDVYEAGQRIKEQQQYQQQAKDLQQQHYENKMRQLFDEPSSKSGNTNVPSDPSSYQQGYKPYATLTDEVGGYMKALGDIGKSVGSEIYSGVKSVGSVANDILPQTPLSYLKTGYDLARGILIPDKAENRSPIERLGASWTRGTDQMLGDGIGGTLKYLGDKMGSQTVHDMGKSVTDYAYDNMKGFQGLDKFNNHQFQMKDLMNPDYLIDRGGEIVPNVALSYATGSALLGGLSKINKLQGLAGILTNHLASGLVMATEDSMQEAGSVYNQAEQRGLNPTEAYGKDFRDNLITNTLLDAGQLGFGHLPITSKIFDKVGKVGAVTLKTAGGSATEGIQEANQNRISANALGDPFSWTDPSTIEAGMLGALMGGATTGVHTAHDILTHVDEKVQSNLSDEQKRRFDTAKQHGLNQGMTEEQAHDFAYEDLVQNGGEDVITNATHDYINDLKIKEEMNQKAEEQQYSTRKPVGTIVENGDTVIWKDKGIPLTVVDSKDPSMLVVQNALGTEFQIGRSQVEHPQASLPEATVLDNPVQSPVIDNGQVGEMGFHIPNEEPVQEQVQPHHSDPFHYDKQNILDQLIPVGSTVTTGKNQLEVMGYSPNLDKTTVKNTKTGATQEIPTHAILRNPNNVNHVEGASDLVQKFMKPELNDDPLHHTEDALYPFFSQLSPQDQHDYINEMDTARTNRDVNRINNAYFGEQLNHAEVLANAPIHDVPVQEVHQPVQEQQPVNEPTVDSPFFIKGQIVSKNGIPFKVDKDFHIDPTRPFEAQKSVHVHDHNSNNHQTYSIPIEQMDNHEELKQVFDSFGHEPQMIDHPYHVGDTVGWRVIHDFKGKSYTTDSLDEEGEPIRNASKVLNDGYSTRGTVIERDPSGHYITVDAGGKIGTHVVPTSRLYEWQHKKGTGKVAETGRTSEKGAQAQFDEMKKEFFTMGKRTPQHRMKKLEELKAFAEANGIEFNQGLQTHLDNFKKQVEQNKEDKATEKEKQRKQEEENQKRQEAYAEKERSKAEDISPEDEHIYHHLMEYDRYQALSKKERKSLVNKIRKMDRHVAVVLEDTQHGWDVYNMFDMNIDEMKQKLVENYPDRYTETNHDVIEMTKDFIDGGQEVQTNHSEEYNAVKDMLEKDPYLSTNNIQEKLMWEEMSLTTHEIDNIRNQILGENAPTEDPAHAEDFNRMKEAERQATEEENRKIAEEQAQKEEEKRQEEQAKKDKKAQDEKQINDNINTLSEHTARMNEIMNDINLSEAERYAQIPFAKEGKLEKDGKIIRYTFDGRLPHELERLITDQRFKRKSAHIGKVTYERNRPNGITISMQKALDRINKKLPTYNETTQQDNGRVNESQGSETVTKNETEFKKGAFVKNKISNVTGVLETDYKEGEMLRVLAPAGLTVSGMESHGAMQFWNKDDVVPPSEILKEKVEALKKPQLKTFVDTAERYNKFEDFKQAELDEDSVDGSGFPEMAYSENKKSATVKFTPMERFGRQEPKQEWIFPIKGELLGMPYRNEDINGKKMKHIFSVADVNDYMNMEYAMEGSKLQELRDVAYGIPSAQSFVQKHGFFNLEDFYNTVNFARQQELDSAKEMLGQEVKNNANEVRTDVSPTPRENTTNEVQGDEPSSTPNPSDTETKGNEQGNADVTGKGNTDLGSGEASLEKFTDGVNHFAEKLANFPNFQTYVKENPNDSVNNLSMIFNRHITDWVVDRMNDAMENNRDGEMKVLDQMFNDRSSKLVIAKALERLNKEGEKNVSNINGTGKLPNGTPTEPVQGTETNKPTETVSGKDGERPNDGSKRTNDSKPSTESNQGTKQPNGSAGDTITSPSNNGIPHERIVPLDHVITEDIFEPNAKKRFENNIKAINVLKMLEREDRFGTAEELDTLAKYQGWGGLPEYFDRSKPQYAELQSHVESGLITQQEWEGMRDTVLTSFYTSHEIASQMYDVLLGAGFDGGKILESSVGNGMFVGAFPVDEVKGKHKFTTVELNDLSHRITKALYPNQTHHHMGFQNFSATEGSFDVVIGNVPFVDKKVNDLTYTDKTKGQKKDEEGNRLPKGKLDHNGVLMTYATHNVHDYFLVKNLDLLKEGGIGLLITSTSSLDGKEWQSQQVRGYIEANTDFFEAIRLPQGAFKHAGTNVATDILFFRKKVQGSNHTSSRIAENVSYDGRSRSKLNEYFIANPEQLAGGMKEGTRYHDELVFTNDGFEEKFKKAFETIKKIFENRFIHGNAVSDVPVKVNNAVSEDWAKETIGQHEGAIHERGGVFFQYTYGQWIPYKVAKEHVPVLRDSLKVRQSYLDLMAKEENKAIPSEDMVKEREALNKMYDDFVKTHGEMNKQGVLTPFEKDVHTVAMLRSLEKRDGKKWAKVDLFKARQTFPDVVMDTKGNVKEALNLSLVHRGELDLQLVSDLLGKSKDDTIAELEKDGHIYYDPQEKAYVTDDEYLSGNIAKKLAVAKANGLNRNIAELEKVLPSQLTMEQIADDIRFGQGWIPKEVYKRFIEKTLGLSNVTVTHNFDTATWGLKSTTGRSHHNNETFAISHKYAKYGKTGIQVIEDLMNMKSSKPPLDVENTPMREQDKAREEILNISNRVVEQLQNELKQFVIGEPDVNENLTKLYNDSFTSVVPRTYDGERMYGTDENPVEIPNLNPVYKLYKHQKDAVMRILRSANTLLAHVVGAGKSLEMQVSIMEGRRLGIIKKPMMVVPTFMMEQHAREFQHSYPNAKIKVIGTGKTEKDIAGITITRNAKWSDEQYEMEVEKNRALRFRSLADVKYGDYDVVIMSYESFKRLGLNPENEQEFLHSEISKLRSFLESVQSEDGKSPTVKEIQKVIEKHEAKIETLMQKDKKDLGISFEELGVDALFVDEAHSYKNLQYHTKLGSIGGLPNSNSQQAFDMYMKTSYMNKNNGKVVFATGTPIANSMAEMFTTLRYLAPNELKQLGMEHFDGWAQMFGSTVNSVELNTAGKFVEKTRFSKFTSVAELMRIFKSIADIKMADDIPYLKRPNADRITITTPMNEKQRTYLEIIVKRAEVVANGIDDPSKDNPLKLTGEGKQLALDYRLFDGTAESDPRSKLNEIANGVVDEYKRTTKDNVGVDGEGKEFKFDNGTQIVFMDIGVPKASDKVKEDDEGNNDSAFDKSMYQNLKDRLVELGIDENHIAFIHDYNKPDQKKKLSQLFNDGQIRILIGSTGKMGVGMNLQKRLTMLHHADPTWRPADIEQREGRIIRQGNFNPNVAIKTYVTEGSFDALMWNTLESKAKFIAQVMSGGTEIRSMDEIAEQIMSFSEIKASATGNTSMIELMKIEKEIRRLVDLQREFTKQKGKAIKLIAEYPEKKASLEETLAFDKKLEAKAKSTRGDDFHLVMDGKTFTDRKEGTEALREKVLDIRKKERKQNYQEVLGQLGGVDVVMYGRKSAYQSLGLDESLIIGEIAKDGTVNGYNRTQASDIIASEGRGTMARLENTVETLAKKGYSPYTEKQLAELEVAKKESEKKATENFTEGDKLRELENNVISLRQEALQHELTNNFDTVFRADGKLYTVTGIDYRAVPSKNKQKLKEDKPDYKTDVVVSEITDITKSSDPDLFGAGNETEHEIYTTGNSEQMPVTEFIRNYQRTDRKGITEGEATKRKHNAESIRQQEAEQRTKAEGENNTAKNLKAGKKDRIKNLLDTSLDGGTTNVISPKVAKKIGDRIANALDTVLREGYVRGGSQVRAMYDTHRKTGNVRGVEVHNLRVTAHELGHAFVNNVGFDVFKSLEKELTHVANEVYPDLTGLNPVEVAEEGLAELFQMYFIDNEGAKQLAPQSVSFIDTFIEGNKELKSAFDDAKEWATKDTEGDSFTRGSGTVKFPKDDKISKGIGEEYKVGKVDKHAPIRKKLTGTVKGFVARRVFDLVDFTIPFQDMEKANGDIKDFQLVKRVVLAGEGRDKAINSFTGWAKDNSGRNIIQYDNFSELPDHLHDLYLAIEREDKTVVPPSTLKRYENFYKEYKKDSSITNPKELANLHAISSRSLQEVAMDGLEKINLTLKGKALDGMRSPAIQQALDTILGKENDMSAFETLSVIMQAYRYNERYSRLNQDGEQKFEVNPMSENLTKKIIEDSRQLFPFLENIVKEYTENLSNIVLEKALQGTVIDEITKEKVKQGSSFYIPTYYASKREGLNGQDGQRKSARQTVKTYTGKQAIVLDFLTASMYKLVETETSAEFKGVLNSLENALRTEGMGQFGEIIPSQSYVARISAGQIDEAVATILNQDLGINPDDVEGSLSGHVFQIFMKRDQLSSKEPILMNWKYDSKGKRIPVFMRVAPDIYNALASMQPLTVGAYLRIVSRLSGFTRLTNIATAKFITDSLVRDTMGTAMQTNSGRGAIYSLFKGTALALGMDKNTTEQYINSGGMSASTESVLRNFRKANKMEDLLPTGDPTLFKLKNNKLFKVFNPSAYLHKGESIHRMGQWFAMIQKLAEEEGLSFNDIMDGRKKLSAEDRKKVEKIFISAGHEANIITTNFRLHGVNQGFRKVTMPVSFAHGSIQGMYRESTEFKTNPKRVLGRMAMKILPITLMMYFLAKALDRDDKYDDIPSYFRDRYWLMPTGFGYIAIAKPFMYALPMAYVERFLDSQFGSEEARKIGEDWFNPIDQAFSMPVVPIWISTMLELNSNKTYFGSPIVPDYLQKKPTLEQYDENTSSFSKWQAKAYFDYVNKGKSPEDMKYFGGISPMKMDYFIKGFFGKYGAGALELFMGKPQKDTPVVGNMFYTNDEFGSRNTTKFYDKAHEVVEGAKDRYGVKYHPNEIVKSYEGMRSTMTTIGAMKRDVSNANISPQEKKDYLSKLEKARMDIARIGNKYKPHDENNLNEVWNWVQQYNAQKKEQEKQLRKK